MFSSYERLLIKRFLFSAISLIWAEVTFPTFSLFGSPDPFGIPAASRINDGAGGVLVIKE